MAMKYLPQPMSEKERGMIFGLSTIILFFTAFGVGFQEKSAKTIFNKPRWVNWMN